MQELADPHFWLKWLQIVILDICLAGDNALVIAMAVRNLPARDQFWGRIWGTMGAVGLRLGFIVIASHLLERPFLQLVGGLFLIWIAWKLLQPQSSHEGENIKQGTTLRDAIWIIILADVVMSLDNVIAISAAAKGDMVLVVFGLLLSLPLVVWGSGILATLMKRFPAIIWAGGGVLGYVAVHMILHDPWVKDRLGDNLEATLRYAGPWALAIILTLLGWWLARGAESANSAPKTP